MSDKPQTIHDEIYNILYEHSTVDGVRVLYEDQWPVDEIVQAIREAIERAKPVARPADPSSDDFTDGFNLGIRLAKNGIISELGIEEKSNSE